MVDRSLRRLLVLVTVLVPIGSATVAAIGGAAQRPPGYAIVDLGPSEPGLTAAGTGINARGAVVGWARRSDGASMALYSRDGEPFGELGPVGASSFALDINRVRIVVGWVSVADAASGQSGPIRAARWQSGEAADLGTLGGETSIAYGINDAGQIVGGSTFSPGDARQRAFLWADGEMTDLGSLPGIDVSVAVDVNADGQTVGFAGDGSQGADQIVAVLWHDGEIADLNSLIPEGGGIRLIQASAINDAGQIVGTGLAADGRQRVYLLTPSEG